MILIFFGAGDTVFFFIETVTSSCPHCGTEQIIFALAKNVVLRRFINARLQVR